MRKRLIVVLLTSVSLAVAVASCGSESSPPVQATNDGGGDAGTLTDAHANPQDGANVPSGCPATTPADGTACPLPALQCEYGEFEWADCNSTATCTTQGWSVAPPPTDACTNHNSFCPSASTTIHNGDTCPSAMTCFYADITCSCNAKGNPDAGLVWSCDDGPSDCPSPRPHLGTPCGEEGKVCDYSSCGKGGTTVENIQERCKGGVWQFLFPTCDGG